LTVGRGIDALLIAAAGTKNALCGRPAPPVRWCVRHTPGQNASRQPVNRIARTASWRN